DWAQELPAPRLGCRWSKCRGDLHLARHGQAQRDQPAVCTCATSWSASRITRSTASTSCCPGSWLHSFVLCGTTSSRRRPDRSDCWAAPEFARAAVMSRAASPQRRASTQAYQLYVELEWGHPKVWRRFLVPIAIELPLLHATLLFGTGWQ